MTEVCMLGVGSGVGVGVGAPFLPPAEHWEEESQRPNRSDHFENLRAGTRRESGPTEETAGPGRGIAF